MDSALQGPTVVIGAGIVGLCVAYELTKRGHEVLILDPNDPGSQCSYGNAGAISAGSVAPLAMPGIMKSAGKMLLDPDAPLHIPFRHWLRSAPWLARFIAAAHPRKVEQIASALTELFDQALENHLALAAELGRPDLVVRSGQLHLYRDHAALGKDEASWRLRKSRGVEIRLLDADEIHALEPAVGKNYQVGVFMPEQGAVIEPFEYATAIAQATSQRGAVFQRERVRKLLPEQDGWTIQCEHGRYRASQVVVAAGAWSAALLRPLGWRVPLETQRGYHLHLTASNLALSRPVVLADRKVFLAPMQSGLRIAGTVEFAGLTAAPNHRRAFLLGEHAKEGFPGLRIEDRPQVWMGHRPCLPDSLPVLGAVPGRTGLWCAFGHGHLGVTGSINTGKLIATAISEGKTESIPRPFSIARFA